MPDDEEDRPKALAPQAPKELSIRASLVSRGLEDVSVGWLEEGFDLWGRCRFTEALEVFSRAHMISPSHSDSWISLNIPYPDPNPFEDWIKEVFGQVIAALDTRLAIEPDFAWLWWNKGLILASQGHFEEALDCLSQAANLNQTRPEVWKAKGWVLQELKRPADALECLRRAIAEPLEDRPNLSAALFSGTIWQLIGSCLLDLGRYDEAINAFDRALEFTPQDTYCYLLKGVALKRAGRPESAIKWYDRFLQLQPESVSGLRNKAIALLALHRYQEAIECCDHALVLHVDQDQRLNLLNDKGVALRALGRPIEALDCYDLALSFELNFKENTSVHASAVRTWQNKAALLDQLGRYEEAVACDNCVLQRDPENTKSWTDKARRLRRLGRIEEAEECDRHA